MTAVKGLNSVAGFSSCRGSTPLLAVVVAPCACWRFGALLACCCGAGPLGWPALLEEAAWGCGFAGAGSAVPRRCPCPLKPVLSG